MHTEHEMLMWLVYCGAVAGFLVAFAAPFNVDVPAPAFLFGLGLGAGAGGVITAVFGFLVGLFVAPTYDTGWRPGVGFAIVNGLLGLLVGFLPGLATGAIGATLGSMIKR